MKYLFIKNIYLIKKIISLEYRKLKYKSIFWNTIFPFYIRQLAYYNYLNLINNKLYSLIRWKRHCLISRRNNYLFKKFKLSRMVLKINISKSLILGVRKSSW